MKNQGDDPEIVPEEPVEIEEPEWQPGDPEEQQDVPEFPEKEYEPLTWPFRREDE
jgi:hypothetical protein